MRRYRFSAALPEVDMTPMIDCTFQLITFFMFTISFEHSEADERIRLPESSLARPPIVQIEDELVLQVGFLAKPAPGERPEPVVFYSHESVPLSQMGEKLALERQMYRLKHPQGAIQTNIVIRGDARVPTGIVQDLVRLCQQHGYERFVLKAKEQQLP